MTKVIGRSGLISSGLSQQKRHRSSIRAAGVPRVRMVNRFPSMKLKVSSLRSLTGGNFLGRRVGGGGEELCVRERKRIQAVTAQLTAGIIGMNLLASVAASEMSNIINS